jgi:regulator of nonsense transcripts 1
MLNGARIVLSTLATLSNPGLDHVGIFSLVPVERLVVDEASQINAFEFMVWINLLGQLRCSLIHSQHVFYKFRKSLEKICFFGDPMQCMWFCRINRHPIDFQIKCRRMARTKRLH